MTAVASRDVASSNDGLPGRVPPQNQEAEQAVLGSILIDNAAFDEVSGLLDADMFYREAHRKIFVAITRLLQANQPADMVTLIEILRTNGQLEEVGGPAYLVGLCEAVPVSLYAAHYAKIVRKKAGFRDLIATSSKALQLAFDEAGTVEDIVARTSGLLDSIVERGSSAGFTTLADLTDQVLDDAVNNRVNVGIPTGFPDLDACLLGLHNGEVIILAGASSSGKTAFGLDMVLNATVKHGYRAGVFSLEMPSKSLVSRAIAREARVNMQTLRAGKARDTDKTKLIAAASRLKTGGVVFDDLTGLSSAEMKSRFRLMRRKYNVDLILIDYLQLVEGPDSATREQQVAAVSRCIKASARELDIPIIALCQINDEHRKRPDRKPTGQHDLRESKAIYQDADVVMFIHRHEYFFPGEKEGLAEIIVAKQRNGPLDTIELVFQKQFVRFQSSGGDEPLL